MKSFLMGLILQVIIILAYTVTKNEKVFIYGTQIVGLGSLGIGVLLSGLMSGNIYRRTVVENQNERIERMSISTRFVLFGAPSIVALAIYYIFLK